MSDESECAGGYAQPGLAVPRATSKFAHGTTRRALLWSRAQKKKTRPVVESCLTAAGGSCRKILREHNITFSRIEVHEPRY